MIGEQGMRRGLGSMMATAPRRTNIMGEPHMLAYINPQEEMVLRQMGGSGLPGPSGIPSYFQFGMYGGGGYEDAAYGGSQSDFYSGGGFGAVLILIRRIGRVLLITGYFLFLMTMITRRHLLS